MVPEAQLLPLLAGSYYPSRFPASEAKSEQFLENHFSLSLHTLELWSLLLGGSGIRPLMVSVPLPT